MQRISLNQAVLAYEVVGTGEPVVLIHGTPVADAFRPLLAEPALLGRFQFVHYHRRGYVEPIGRSERWATMADQAADAAALLDHLGLRSAHIVGYDMGGLIALQLAADRPDLVHSLTLLEPLIMAVASWTDVAPEVVPAIEAYRSGNRDEAVRILLEVGAGPEASSVLAAALPGALSRAAHDAGAFFEEEFLAIGQWEAPLPEWEMIRQPVLSVLGEHTLGFFREGREVLRDYLIQCSSFDLFSASHLLQMENPEGMAAGLASFLSQHRLA